MFQGTLRSRRAHWTNRCTTSKIGRIDPTMLAPSVTTRWSRGTSKHRSDISKTLKWSVATTRATTGKTINTSRRISTNEEAPAQLMTHRSMQLQHWRCTRTSPRLQYCRGKSNYLTSTINTTVKQLRIKAAWAITQGRHRITEGSTNGKIIGSTSIRTCRISPMDPRIKTWTAPTFQVWVTWILTTTFTTQHPPGITACWRAISATSNRCRIIIQ